MMTTWYIKELATLTAVSVRTLHHYDQIELLQPSLRQENGYRVYSENDLLKLQQIIAMKYFGFSLSQIKIILVNNMDILKQFAMQAKLLQKKVDTLSKASCTLNDVIADCEQSKQIPWEKIIKMIEVFTMTQKLENAWVADVFNKEQLKEYAKFEQDLDKSTKDIFEKNWFHLLTLVSANINKDPSSEIGASLGRQCMDVVNSLYGKAHRHLRNTLWEQGFQKNKMEKDHGITPEMVDWLDKAIEAYYGNRITEILSQIGVADDYKVRAQWEELLEDKHGTDEKLNQAFVKALLDSNDISSAAKKWLVSL